MKCERMTKPNELRENEQMNGACAKASLFVSFVHDISTHTMEEREGGDFRIKTFYRHFAASVQSIYPRVYRTTRERERREGEYWIFCKLNVL